MVNKLSISSSSLVAGRQLTAMLVPIYKPLTKVTTWHSNVTLRRRFVFKDINSDYWKALVLSLITAGGNKTWGSVTGTLQQIIPGKVPEGDLAKCHIPGGRNKPGTNARHPGPKSGTKYCQQNIAVKHACIELKFGLNVVYRLFFKMHISIFLHPPYFYYMQVKYRTMSWNTDPVSTFSVLTMSRNS